MKFKTDFDKLASSTMQYSIASFSSISSNKNFFSWNLIDLHSLRKLFHQFTLLFYPFVLSSLSLLSRISWLVKTLLTSATSSFIFYFKALMQSCLALRRSLLCFSSIISISCSFFSYYSVKTGGYPCFDYFFYIKSTLSSESFPLWSAAFYVSAF